ncbi:MAG: nucleotide exchange factor GrpE [Tannerella sp.]|jgi:molecular chaperone GrpE|nr:nucleotide exchange factor GrpE [Tannerella sp.]
MIINEKEKHVETEKEFFSGEAEATKNQQEPENASENAEPTDNVTDKKDEVEEAERINALEEKYKELNDSHLRLMAEFDNYRKRTLREKADLIKSGGESVLTNLLPVIDDFERALNNIQNTKDVNAIVQGVELIFNKFTAYLLQQGVKQIEAIGQPFNTELFEAIATLPAPEESQKGNVLDCVQTGYTLYDKVIRHAKVVVGE